MWLISSSYLVVYMTRTAALDWAQLFLIQEAGQSEFTGELRHAARGTNVFFLNIVLIHLSVCSLMCDLQARIRTSVHSFVCIFTSYQ